MSLWETTMRVLTALLFLAVSAPIAADDVVPADEVESYVNIRSAPDASADAVSRLHRSRPRMHVRTLDGWYEVELDDGTTGFVSSDWSKIVAETESDADESAVAAAVETPETESAADESTGSEQAFETIIADAVIEDISSPAEAKPMPPVDAPVASVTESKPTENVEPPVNEPQAPPEPVAEEPEPVAEASVTVDPADEVVSEETPDAPQPVVEAPAAGAVENTITVVGPPGPPGPAGPPGPPGEGAVKGTKNFLVKFKDPTVGGNSQVFDDGNRVGIGTDEPGQRLDVNGSVQIHDRTSAVAGLMIKQIRGEAGYVLHNQAGTLTIGAASIDRITIDRNGNIGFGVNRPQHPIEMANGAYVTAGGVWTNSSSRARKDDIESLTLEDALTALADLEPVEFRYRRDTDETHLGFIAEDVPELVAMEDRKSLSPMDIVAVLTKVVQAQQEQIAELERKVDEQQR